MPTPPRTWSANDLVNPTHLNSDLYNYNFATYWPTGVQFFCRRPAYKSAPTGSGAPISGYTDVDVYLVYYESLVYFEPATVVCDTSADYGTGIDPADIGEMVSGLPAASGIVNDIGGGWWLALAFVTMSGLVTVQAGLKEAGPSGTSYNYGQIGAEASPWTGDLLHYPAALPGEEAVSYTPVFLLKVGTSPTSVTTADGSGATCRTMMLWGCSDAGSPLPATYPPFPKQQWGPSDTWTSAWANGAAGIRDVLRFLNFPPCLRAQCTAATGISGGGTKLPLTAQLDSWTALASGTWTCPADGLYLVLGCVYVTGTDVSAQCAVAINGTLYYGPPGSPGLDPSAATGMKAQVFSLLKGDTVALYAAGSGTTGSAPYPRLIIMYLSGQGIPGLANTSNPYFTGGLTAGWSAVSGTIAATTSPSSGNLYPCSMTLTPSGSASSCSAQESGAPFAISPSAWVGFSAWVKATGTSNVQYGMTWGSSGSTVSSSLVTAAPAAGQWVLLHVIQQAPASGVNQAWPYLGREASSGDVSAGDLLEIAGVQCAVSGAGQPAPPDLGFRYQDGTLAASVVSTLNAYLANDLSFTCQRPYLLAYQTATSSTAKVAMNAVAGIIHGDYGDNFAGWSAASGWYAAPVAGWYLVVEEIFTGGSTTAEFTLSVPGASATDSYESSSGGAAGISIYYLRAGDWIYPTAGGTTGTTVAAGKNSHLEIVWLSE